MTRHLIQWGVAMTIIVVIITTTPILDLLETFLMAALIPLVFFMAIGLMSESSYELIKSLASLNTVGLLRARIDDFLEHLRANGADAPTV